MKGKSAAIRLSIGYKFRRRSKWYQRQRLTNNLRADAGTAVCVLRHGDKLLCFGMLDGMLGCVSSLAAGRVISSGQ